MAKASSPVRLESSLMDAATVAGSMLHRSATEQIEYWADLGRRVAQVLTPETLLAVNAGLVRIRVEDASTAAVNADAVFAALDKGRVEGSLTQAISPGRIRYQASVSHPGCLEQISPEGKVTVGRFHNGEFEPL